MEIELYSFNERVLLVCSSYVVASDGLSVILLTEKPSAKSCRQSTLINIFEGRDNSVLIRITVWIKDFFTEFPLQKGIFRVIS